MTIHDSLKISDTVQVLVAGDAMLDRFVQGTSTRLAPEAPVPVLRAVHAETMPGGAANVAANLHALGVRTDLVALIGRDADGIALRAMMKERGCAGEGLVETAQRPTTVKTRFAASGHPLLRVDVETAEPMDGALEKTLLDRAKALIMQFHALVLSDYGKGVLTPAVLQGLIACAREKKIPVLADPKGRDYTIYRGVDVLTPNLRELGEASGLPVDSDEAIVKTARRVMRATGIGAMIVTRSQDGVSLVRENTALHLPAAASRVASVSGAGDTLMAAVAAALASGKSLEDAVHAGNTAAGLAVAKSGTSIVSGSELSHALSGAPRPPEGREAPVCGAGDAARRIRDWQNRGLKVGFTNGCFDILHAGHAGYLGRARDLCDRLVVGLNSDSSVRRLKGPDRPVNDEAGRAGVMAALAAVDMVVIFGDDPKEDDKPVRLVDRLRPDVFFKGGDYTEDRLPEAKTVRAYGGSVHIMPLYEGRSTTSTITKIRRAE